MVLIPVVVAAALFLWWLWLGRDPRPRTIVPTWRPPEGIQPGLAGTLIDQRADPGDVLATILDLARRGYLVIIEAHPSGVPAAGGRDASIARTLLEKTGVWQTEWRFERTGKPLDDLLPFEGAVMVALFGAASETTASALRPHFHAHLPAIYGSFYDQLVRRGYFLRSPEAARREWLSLAGLVAAAGAVGIFVGDPPLGLALLLSGGIVFMFARAMPVPTRRGAILRDRIEGLREYIRRAEKEEIEARHGPERTPHLFDELLPWAVALDVSDIWLHEFGELLPQAPPWYAREGASAETASLEVDLSTFFTAALQVMSADR